MNLKENLQRIEKCEYKCVAGELLKNSEWVELRKKIFKINEIIWSLRHGNFNNSEEAMDEIDELFNYEDYANYAQTDQDEFYHESAEVTK